MDQDSIYITEISNYYGGLSAHEQDGKFFWGISDHDGETEYHEIPESLYNELKKYEQSRSNLWVDFHDDSDQAEEWGCDSCKS
jgi:hypothetical protein